ncbi:MAG: DUF4091 domain-containing protein [Clostridia bacterium]|nr:DUF4091 domain-containing protein [Clostridia bacterium]
MKKTIVSLLLVSAMLLSLFVMPTGAEESIADSYVHVDAEYEDSEIALWFDYAGEKVSDSTVKNTGKESFLIYMAKNEIEDAQFFLSADADKKGLTASITEFSDGNGNIVDAELFIEYYHDCADLGTVPDAIPPLSAYGAFDLTAGKSQGFIIKLTTTAETVAGDYSAKLSVYDADGKEVKTTTVYAHVWNFELSEATASATSINLDVNYLLKAHPGVDSDTIYKTYYNYLLENRISAYYLPENPYSSAAAEYMDNPRVTSYQLTNKSGGALNSLQINSMFKTNFNVEGGEERLKKAYYFAGVVDADEPADLEALKTAYDSFNSKYSSKTDIPVSFISTYIFDIDYTLEDGTVIDQVKYYEDFVNHWCSKTFAYTAPEELTVPGSKVLQPLKWDSVYGTFKERMATQRAEGDKVWWFISWDVEAPYINYYMQTNGTAQRILFWQQFDNDVQGFLYNFANFWIMENNDPYASNITNSSYPNAHGESVLLYPGTPYGFDGPVGSLRLEAMRDGIEDYQMFTMLEDLRGEGAADKIIDRVTTGMVNYSTDGGEYYAARVELGNAVEAAVNGTDEPEVPEFVVGDINNDDKINVQDIFRMKLFIKTLVEPTEAERLSADITGDGLINAADTFKLSYRVLNGEWA